MIGIGQEDKMVTYEESEKAIEGNPQWKYKLDTRLSTPY